MYWKRKEKGAERGTETGDKNGRRGEWWEVAKLAFYKECSKCAQEMLVVTEVEDVSCQDPKGNPVKILEW